MYEVINTLFLGLSLLIKRVREEDMLIIKSMYTNCLTALKSNAIFRLSDVYAIPISLSPASLSHHI